MNKKNLYLLIVGILCAALVCAALIGVISGVWNNDPGEDTQPGESTVNTTGTAPAQDSVGESTGETTLPDPTETTGVQETKPNETTGNGGNAEDPTTGNTPAPDETTEPDKNNEKGPSITTEPTQDPSGNETDIPMPTESDIEIDFGDF